MKKAIAVIIAVVFILAWLGFVSADIDLFEIDSSFFDNIGDKLSNIVSAIVSGIQDFFEEDIDKEDPDDTLPQDTEPSDSVPDDSESEDTPPVDTDPEDTDPIDTEPVDTEPEDTEPEDTEPIIPDVPEPTTANVVMSTDCTNLAQIKYSVDKSTGMTTLAAGEITAGEIYFQLQNSDEYIVYISKTSLNGTVLLTLDSDAIKSMNVVPGETLYLWCEAVPEPEPVTVVMSADCESWAEIQYSVDSNVTTGSEYLRSGEITAGKLYLLLKNYDTYIVYVSKDGLNGTPLVTLNSEYVKSLDVAEGETIYLWIDEIPEPEPTTATVVMSADCSSLAQIKYSVDNSGINSLLSAGEIIAGEIYFQLQNSDEYIVYISKTSLNGTVLLTLDSDAIKSMNVVPGETIYLWCEAASEPEPTTANVVMSADCSSLAQIKYSVDKSTGMTTLAAGEITAGEIYFQLQNSDEYIVYISKTSLNGTVLLTLDSDAIKSMNVVPGETIYLWCEAVPEPEPVTVVMSADCESWAEIQYSVDSNVTTGSEYLRSGEITAGKLYLLLKNYDTYIVYVSKDGLNGTPLVTLNSEYVKSLDVAEGETIYLWIETATQPEPEPTTANVVMSTDCTNLAQIKYSVDTSTGMTTLTAGEITAGEIYFQLQNSDEYIVYISKTSLNGTVLLTLDSDAIKSMNVVPGETLYLWCEAVPEPEPTTANVVMSADCESWAEIRFSVNSNVTTTSEFLRSGEITAGTVYFKLENYDIYKVCISKDSMYGETALTLDSEYSESLSVSPGETIYLWLETENEEAARFANFYWTDNIVVTSIWDDSDDQGAYSGIKLQVGKTYYISFEGKYEICYVGKSVGSEPLVIIPEGDLNFEFTPSEETSYYFYCETDVESGSGSGGDSGNTGSGGNTGGEGGGSSKVTTANVVMSQYVLGFVNIRYSVDSNVTISSPYLNEGEISPGTVYFYLENYDTYTVYISKTAMYGSVALTLNNEYSKSLSVSAGETLYMWVEGESNND